MGDFYNDYNGAAAPLPYAPGQAGGYAPGQAPYNYGQQQAYAPGAPQNQGLNLLDNTFEGGARIQQNRDQIKLEAFKFGSARSFPIDAELTYIDVMNNNNYSEQSTINMSLSGGEYYIDPSFSHFAYQFLPYKKSGTSTAKVKLDYNTSALVSTTKLFFNNEEKSKLKLDYVNTVINFLNDRRQENKKILRAKTTITSALDSSQTNYTSGIRGDPTQEIVINDTVLGNETAGIAVTLTGTTTVIQSEFDYIWRAQKTTKPREGIELTLNSSSTATDYKYNLISDMDCPILGKWANRYFNANAVDTINYQMVLDSCTNSFVSTATDETSSSLVMNYYIKNLRFYFKKIKVMGSLKQQLQEIYTSQGMWIYAQVFNSWEIVSFQCTSNPFNYTLSNQLESVTGFTIILQRQMDESSIANYSRSNWMGGIYEFWAEIEGQKIPASYDTYTTWPQYYYLELCKSANGSANYNSDRSKYFYDDQCMMDSSKPTTSTVSDITNTCYIQPPTTAGDTSDIWNCMYTTVAQIRENFYINYNFGHKPAYGDFQDTVVNIRPSTMKLHILFAGDTPTYYVNIIFWKSQLLTCYNTFATNGNQKRVEFTNRI